MGKFIKRERLYLGEGMRFGIGRGRFFVTHIADGQCQMEYNLKARTKPEGTFVLPTKIAEELLQVEVVERMLQQESDKHRYWRRRATVLQNLDKGQMELSIERLNKRVFELEETERELRDNKNCLETIKNLNNQLGGLIEEQTVLTQEKEQLQDSVERLKRRVIQLEAGEAESYNKLTDAKKLLQTAMDELQESEAAAFKSEAAASKWRMIALFMLVGNLVLFGSFAIYLKFFL
jgi:chromosome segregation ATPase